MKTSGIRLSKISARQRLVRHLMLTASAVAGFAGAASAQETGTQQETTAPTSAQDGASDIVVTGYRQSIEASLEQKRDANAFIDVITAEDVGKFPDKNVADSLQRVPGVIISRDGGEGSRVSIRGLSSDLTLTELNGNFIASTGDNPSRSFDYVLLPSTFIGSVEVYKSAEARLDEGGVGGVIINHTRKPFDLDAWSGNVQVEGTYADVTEKVEPNVSGLLSWKDPEERLGFLVGATYQERTNRTLSAYGSSWHWWTDDKSTQPAVDVNGNTFANDDAISYWNSGNDAGTTTRDGTHYSGYWAPQSVGETIQDEKRKRLGIQATAQMKPFDNLTITANYFRFQVKGDYISSTIKVPEWGYGNFFTGARLDPSGTIFTGATFEVPPEGTGCRVPGNLCTMETPAPQNTLVRQKKVSNTFDVQGDWNKDRLDVHFALGKTKSDGGPSFQFYAQAKPRNGTTNGNFLSAWDFTKQGMSMEFTPEVLQNMLAGTAQIDLGSTGSGFSNSTLSQRYAQVDVTRHFDSFIDSIQVGAKWRDASIHRETGRFEWYSDDANTRRFQDTPGGALALPEFFYPDSLSNIPGGFETNAFPAINIKNYIDYLNKTYNGPVRVPEPQNLYNIGERIWAGYAQVNYKTETVRGNIGIRLVSTKQSGTSTDVLYYENDYCVDGPAGPFDPNKPVGEDGNCLVIPQDQREVRVYSPNNESKSYTEVLPSFNVAWNVTPDLLVRGAVAKVMARPSYGDLAGARSLTFNADPFVFDRAEFGALPGWFGGGGNFDLKPFKAWQYDVGVEWYFQRGSVVGATLFRKDVSDFIVPLVLDVQQNVAGEEVTIQQYSTQANGSKAVSQGVELYAQHTLSFGLGAQVNFTYNDTSVADVSLNGQKVGTSPLVGSAKTQVNASVFYERGPVLLRASYNRRGEVVGGLSSGLNVYTDPYEQVDLNASYELFNNVQLTASVINLTKSEQRQHLGNDTKARFISNVYSGRRAYVGLSYKF
ncbi:TonB-dependent receptor [Stakelama pacifica]|uniref:TonB-dependent receptor n=1 Tax=Stakelama pacifica TaxID=517720 RepID=A0A4V3BU11_9SPHN|nr:TonB-dependent receptor [Stakelama pacifica]TDN85538.1 TonB-dependent receptor [Stakelama pacifica]GGO92352.1 TonB-dependent receptor [Stakelama pacifica]